MLNFECKTKSKTVGLFCGKNKQEAEKSLKSVATAFKRAGYAAFDLLSTTVGLFCGKNKQEAEKSLKSVATAFKRAGYAAFDLLSTAAVLLLASSTPKISNTPGSSTAGRQAK